MQDVAITNALAGELARDERLVWQGHPDSSRWLYASDVLLVPFSLLWGGFAIVWEVGVLSSRSARDSILFPLWGIPFVVVGLYLILGRFFVRRWIRKRTTYAVTSRRVMSVSPALRGGQRVNSIWLRSYPPVDKRIAGNGRGTLYVGTFPMNQRWLSDTGWPGMNGAAGGSGVVLSDIPDAAEVYSMITASIGGGQERT